jgi:hypothetical protein
LRVALAFVDDRFHLEVGVRHFLLQCHAERLGFVARLLGFCERATNTLFYILQPSNHGLLLNLLYYLL